MARLPTLSFSGGTAQIRRTFWGADTKVLKKSGDRPKWLSGNETVGAEFRRSAARNSTPGALERDAPEAPLNPVDVESTAGNPREPQLRKA